MRDPLETICALSTAAGRAGIAVVRVSGPEAFRLAREVFVPRGAPAATVEARKRDAEALRGRFQGCETGLKVAMAMPDVAVRGAIVRASGNNDGQAQRHAQRETSLFVLVGSAHDSRHDLFIAPGCSLNSLT